MLGASGLIAERDIYRAIHAMTLDLGSQSPIRRTGPLICFLGQAWGIQKLFLKNIHPHKTFLYKIH